MRNISRMLVTGGLAMSLLLTGCGQGGGDPQPDVTDTGEQVTATDEKQPANGGGGGEASASAGAADATIQGLNGWWTVSTYTIKAGEAPDDSMTEEMMTAYAGLFHAPCVLKVNSADKTFEMSAFGIALIGTIENDPVDGWFVMNADSGAGFFDMMDSVKCRLEEDGSLTIAIVAKDAEDKEIPMSYTCVKSEGLADKAVTDSVFAYTYDKYMEYRNANMNLPINWYPEPQVVADKDSCKLFLWGIGETDTEYILMTGVANENPFPLLVSNYFTDTKLTANDSIQIDPMFGCYLFGYDAQTAEQIQVYDCPIRISKSAVNGLTKLSGTLNITTIHLSPYTTLDFTINL